MSATFLASVAKAPCVALATLFVVAPFVALGSAKALTVQEHEVTCPIDGKTFKAPIVAANMTKGMRLDLKPLGSVVAPYPDPVCPDNGFVMYKNEFSQDEMAAIRPLVLSEEYQRLRKENTDYYMVAYMKERMGSGDLDVANAYLGASWEAEREKPELLAAYRARAREKFDAFAARDASQSEQWWTAALLAAELERLLGHFDAVTTRVDALPVTNLPQKLGEEKSETFIKVVDQIRLHALAHNPRLETFSDLVGRRA